MDPHAGVDLGLQRRRRPSRPTLPRPSQFPCRAPAALAKRASKAFSSADVILERFYPTVVVGHMRPVDRALRHTERRRNRRLRQPTLTQQHHLDALALRRRDLPAQRSFQPPLLGLAAFDHLFPPNQMVQANHTSGQERSTTNPGAYLQKPRFKPLWRGYLMVLNHLDFLVFLELQHGEMKMRKLIIAAVAATSFLAATSAANAGYWTPWGMCAPGSTRSTALPA
jgi:hypothetical protein